MVYYIHIYIYIYIYMSVCMYVWNYEDAVVFVAMLAAVWFWNIT